MKNRYTNTKCNLSCHELQELCLRVNINPMTPLSGLTSVIMGHVKVVANLVGHSGGCQVGLVHVEVHRDASSLGCAHTVWHTHA